MLLQARIAVRRWECVQAAAELSKPIAVVDRGIELWHRFAPFLKLFSVPAAFLLTRRLGRKRRDGAKQSRSKIGLLLRALPLVVKGVKTFTAWQTMQKSHPGASTSPAARPTRLPRTMPGI